MKAKTLKCMFCGKKVSESKNLCEDCVKLPFWKKIRMLIKNEISGGLLRK